MAEENLLQKVFRRIRPGSGEKPEAISIIDTNGNRAPSPGGYRPDFTDMASAEANWPVAAAIGTTRGSEPRPTGLLPGVKECDCEGDCKNSKHGAIPRYEPDNAQVLNRLFGFTIPDEE